MLKIGSLVNIVGLPNDNNHWDIPETYIGIRGAMVVRIEKTYIRLDINGSHWNFPIDYKGILEPVVVNKWNPMNYTPRFEPMKLP